MDVTCDVCANIIILRKVFHRLSFFFYIQVHGAKGRQTGSHWRNMKLLEKRIRFTSLLLVYRTGNCWWMTFQTCQFKLSSPRCNHCRSSIVFKHKICVYQDTHLRVKGCQRISRPFQTCSEARAANRTHLELLKQRIAKDIRHRSRRCLVGTVVPSAAAAFSCPGFHRCNARTPSWHLGLRSVWLCVH